MFLGHADNPIWLAAGAVILAAIFTAMHGYQRKIERGVLYWVQHSQPPLLWEEDDEMERRKRHMIDHLIEYCLSKPGAKEDHPFGPDPLVAKVGGKMFALVSGTSISLKCDPVIAENLREQYEAVTPGYHLNKKHWNSIRVDGSIPENELEDMIDHSYELVVKGLPKAARVGLVSNGRA